MSFSGAEIKFNGKVINSDLLPASAIEFNDQLGAAIKEWSAAGLRHIWLTIPISKTDFIPIAIGYGFDFHHSSDGYQNGEAYLTLTKKLDQTVYLPHSATHHIGVGGVVINQQNELLVVREATHADQPGRFKLPGGYVDPGEHIAVAAEREVEEETGVKVRFESLHALRNLHSEDIIGRSNLYMICRLTALSFDLQPEEGEIIECRWLDVERFLTMPTVMPHPKGMVKAVIGDKGGLQLSQIEGYNYFAAEQVELFLPA